MLQPRIQNIFKPQNWLDWPVTRGYLRHPNVDKYA